MHLTHFISLALPHNYFEQPLHYFLIMYNISRCYRGQQHNHCFCCLVPPHDHTMTIVSKYAQIFKCFCSSVPQQQTQPSFIFIIVHNIASGEVLLIILMLAASELLMSTSGSCCLSEAIILLLVMLD
jgi:hypothetical protein